MVGVAKVTNVVPIAPKNSVASDLGFSWSYVSGVEWAGRERCVVAVMVVVISPFPFGVDTFGAFGEAPGEAEPRLLDRERAMLVIDIEGSEIRSCKMMERNRRDDV